MTKNYTSAVATYKCIVVVYKGCCLTVAAPWEKWVLETKLSIYRVEKIIIFAYIKTLDNDHKVSPSIVA